MFFFFLLWKLFLGEKERILHKSLIEKHRGEWGKVKNICSINLAKKYLRQEIKAPSRPTLVLECAHHHMFKTKGGSVWSDVKNITLLDRIVKKKKNAYLLLAYHTCLSITTRTQLFVIMVPTPIEQTQLPVFVPLIYNRSKKQQQKQFMMGFMDLFRPSLTLFCSEIMRRHTHAESSAK